MAKEQKKDTKQGKKTVRKEQSIVLSKNSDKSVRYKIIKIQQNVVMYKKNKTDTASTSVQSQKKADEKPENLQKAANISSKSRRRSSSSASLSKPTTSENNSGDKYRDIAKITAARKMNEAQNGAVAQRATDTNYRVQNQAVVNAMSSSETDRHKAKAAEINEKLKADVTKARNNTAAVENDMKAFAINKAKETYKVKHLVKKGNVDSKRFRNAVNNTIKKEIEQDVNYNKYKGEAVLHYKKMICYTNQEHQISKKIKKADNTASQNEKLLTAATTVVTLVKDPQRAVTNLAEDVIRKSKLGNASLTVAGDIRSFEDASKANSVGDGFSQAMTVLPEKYLKNAVKKTATDVITGRTKAEQLAKKGKKLERKYGHEAAKAQKAERNAKYAKEGAVRKAKVQFYKEEKGLVKSASAMKNTKVAVKKAAEALGKVALEAGKKAIGALIAAIGPELLIILLIIMVIVSLFTWLTPHEETFYNEADNTWEPVMVETNEEILKGYIKHIQDYFDKKQLEILEVVDINFDGFTPDKYDYAKVEDRGGVLNFEDRPKLTTEYTEYYIEKQIQYQEITGYVPGSRYSSGYPIWSETKTISSESEAIMRTEYYKFDYDLGYEVRTTSLDYDIARTYLLCAIDIEAYWNSHNIKDAEGGGKNLEEPDDNEPLFSCENGKFSTHQDITDENIVLRKKGAVVYEGSAVTYILSHPELFAHVVTVRVPGSDDSSIRTLGSSSEWKNRTVTEIISDEQYIFNNYIWNLYEYGNQWIKLSDDCDYEHIIAMAAIKKWQEIEADGFDSNTYTFEITDEDLDYCLDKLYEFYYSYGPGRCRYNNCHKYISGDPPKVHYTCNRAATHKHLIGQVTNLELIGGIDFVLNKVLKIPKRADYSSDEEYAKAKSQFETDKDIYEVYVEYIYNELGTSTKIPDYENDREAQYRLLRMHQAGHGKKPSNPPTNIRCSVRHEDISKTVTGVDTASSLVTTHHSWTDITEHIFLDISWNPPAPEEYSKGKFVEITGYNVYAYNRSSGAKKRIATVSETSCSIDYMIGGGLPTIEYETVDYEKDDGKTIEIQQIKTRTYSVQGLPAYTHIIVEAYNDGGKGPQSEPFYVAIK